MIKVLKKLMNLAGKHQSRLRLAVWFHICYSICEVIPIAGILYGLSAVLKSQQTGEPFSVGVVLGVFFILILSVFGKILFQYLANKSGSMASFAMCADERITIGDRLKRMPMGYFSANSLGEINATVTTTMNEIESMASSVLTNIVVGLVHAIVLTLVVTLFNWKIGLISAVAILLGVWINGKIQEKSMEVAPKKQQVQEALSSAILEYVQGISVVKAYGIADKSNRAVDAAIAESCRQNLSFEKVFTRLTSLYSYLFKAAACAVLMAACYLFAGGELSLLNTLAIIISSFAMYTYIEGIGASTSLLQLIDKNLDKIEAVKNAPVLDENGVDLKPKHFGIQFKEVSFSYDTRKILNNINFDISENTTVAIVGPSGGGKSTICSLMARFWDVDSGAVLMGGHNVKNYTSDSLLKNISMVFQKVYLFNDTIAENIRFGKPEATMEEIMEAAKKACCHDFITALPNGYETLVGEGGGSLSGGEKQRISIARAILKDAPIIILDEATSSADPENEQQLQQAIEELTRQKTVIMIAHRLSTVRSANQIFVLNKGHIVEQGRHEELMRENGLYREFIEVRKQAVGWNLS